PAPVRGRLGKDVLPQLEARLTVPCPGQREAVEEGRRGMTRSDGLRARVGKFGGGRDAPRMIDESIAETNPQLRVAGIALDCVLEDSDGVVALAVAGERLGHAEPAFGRRELAEEGMASLRQREDVAGLHPLGGSAGNARAALERVTSAAEEKHRRARCQRGAANAEQPQCSETKRNQEQQDDEADQAPLLSRIRRRTSQAPISSSPNGASQSGHAAGSVVGL